MCPHKAVWQHPKMKLNAELHLNVLSGSMAVSESGASAVDDLLLAGLIAYLREVLQEKSTDHI